MFPAAMAVTAARNVPRLGILDHFVFKIKGEVGAMKLV